MKLRALALLATIGMTANTLHAQEVHEVHMLNRGEAGTMVFEPAILNIALGDTVRFVAVDRGHNAESIDGMIPEGAGSFYGELNEEYSVTFDVEGAYGYKCAPHFAMGMVGLIVVGDRQENLDTLLEDIRLPRRVRDVFENMLVSIEAEPGAGDDVP